MNKNVPYILIAAVSIIAVLFIGFVIQRSAKTQAPKVTSLSESEFTPADINIADQEIPEQLESKEVTLDTCPPGKHGDLSLTDLNRKPEPTIFEGDKPPKSSALGLVLEKEKNMVIDMLPPTDLQASKIPSGAVQGVWTHTGTTLKAFNVYIKGPGGGWSLLGAVPKNDTGQYVFTDGTQRPAGEYEYALSVVGLDDRQSDCSDGVEITF